MDVLFQDCLLGLSTLEGYPALAISQPNQVQSNHVWRNTFKEYLQQESILPNMVIHSRVVSECQNGSTHVATLETITD